MNARLLRAAAVAAALFFILSAQYGANFFAIAPTSFADGFQADSEILVVGRLVATRDQGFLSHNAALVRLAPSNPAQPPAQATYEAYFENRPAQVEWVYVSQVGVQGIVLAMLDAILPLPAQTRYQIFRWLCAGALAACIVFLSLWMRRNAGGAAGAGFFLAALFSPWLTAYAPNLYWVAFLWFLPAVAVCVMLDKGISWDGGWKPALGIGAPIGLAFLLRYLAGYEFISTVTLMAAAPVVFVALRDGWTIARTLVSGLIVLAASVSAFLISLAIYLFQFGTFDPLYGRMADRLGTEGQAGVAGDTASREAFAMFATKLEVIASYLTTSPASPFTQFGALVLATLAFVLIALLPAKLTYWLDRRRTVAQALALTTVFGFLAPLSWFVVATPHSFVHVSMNFVVWHMPFLLFAGATAAVVVASYVWRMPELARRPLEEGAWAATILGGLGLSLLILNPGKAGDRGAALMPAVVAAEPIYHQSAPDIEVRVSTTRLYFIADCDNPELAVRFFVHLFPPGSSEFVNKDFSFSDAQLPFDFEASGKRKCVAVRSFSRPIERMMFGQFVMPSGPRIWEAEVKLISERTAKLAAINDNNWSNGVYRHAAGFVLDRSRGNQFLATPGAIVSLNGIERRITRVEVTPWYINVFVDGQPYPADAAVEGQVVEFKY